MVLIGNNDRHGRNLGIIETSSTKKITPMYDNPLCLGKDSLKRLELYYYFPEAAIYTVMKNRFKVKDQTIKYVEQFLLKP